MNIYDHIAELLTYAQIHLYMDERDYEYNKNAIFNLLDLHTEETPAPVDEAYIESLDVPDDVVEPIVRYMIDNGICTAEDSDLKKTALMGIVTPKPSIVDDMFASMESSEATYMLYDLGIKSDYIKLSAIKKNKYWRYHTDKCDLEITINLSKPEKDNKEIARLKSAPATGYPKCMLCKENINYQGRVGFPARQTLRYVPISLAGEQWYMQYSPYAYFDEHCIIFASEHAPMTMSKMTFERLVDFTDQFPDYIAGSNACIPIVGGSILTHEHYQGGGHLMPVHYTSARAEYTHPDFPTVRITHQDWYNTDIRLTSFDKTELIRLADKIFRDWTEYSDESVDIVAYTTDKHNAITPIARRIGDQYSLDLLLRNNRTNDTYPDGIFHAHPEYHNIKKEGIGLIEAMGLFILPGRLDRELNEVKKYLIGELTDSAYRDETSPLYKHRAIIDELVERNTMYVDEDTAIEQIHDYVGDVCRKILENTAVFKNTDEGEEAFDRYMTSMGFCRK